MTVDPTAAELYAAWLLRRGVVDTAPVSNNLSTTTETSLTYANLCSQIYQKPCFSGPNGVNWQTVMGGNMDVQMDNLFYGRAVRYPEDTPTDALYYIANERGLERVILIGTGGLQENETLHRLRLKHAWTIWQESGSQQGHVDELSWCGLNNVRVFRRHEASTPPLAGSLYVRTFAREVWSQFDILLRKPMPIQELLWGGFFWGLGGVTWGTTLTTTEIQLLRRLIRDHKSAHDTGTYMHLYFGNGAIWADFVWGDGTLWGGVGNTVTGVIGEKWWETRGLM